MRFFPNALRVKTKLLKEFEGKRVLDLSSTPCLPFIHSKRDQHEISLASPRALHQYLNCFPWNIADNSYDLVICQHVLEHLPDVPQTLEELNRITSPGGKIFIETPHYTWFEAYRHYENCHRFSLGSFDYFHKGNPYYKTDFLPEEKYLFFDDLTFFLGIGFIANLFPRFYEKRLAFIFPATSFHVTFQVDKPQIAGKQAVW